MSTGKKLTSVLEKVVRLRERVERCFSDIRTAPTIPLSEIILTLCLMPLLEVKSLLRLDAATRVTDMKRLFGKASLGLRQLCSDSTMQRVLRWLVPEEASRFLFSLLRVLRRQDADGLHLVPGGPKRRIVVGDGSVMGNHHVVAYALIADGGTYPCMIEGTPGRGHELKRAKEMVHRLPARFPKRHAPQLLLYDYLGFTTAMFRAARTAGMHILVKGGDSHFRGLINDARLLFDVDDPDAEGQSSSFDEQRLSSWELEETSGTFADYPVRVARLVEYASKGDNRDVPRVSWIVTTDFSLSRRELREAAHVRWSIENNVFKRLSGTVATKRFHFKEQQPFITMLRIVCAAIVAYDVLSFMMDRLSAGRKGWIGPMKLTYGVVFAAIYTLLEDSCLA